MPLINGAGRGLRWLIEDVWGQFDADRSRPAERARQLGEAHGWSPSTIRCAMDGLAVLLAGLAGGDHVTLTEIRARAPRQASAPAGR